MITVPLVRAAALLSLLALAGNVAGENEAPVVVPKLWDEAALAEWATPVAGLGLPPGHVSERDYYTTPIDNLRTYPVYHPRFEPPGYRDWMRAQGPKPLIEPSTLRTKADWVEAGRRVFEELDTAVMRSDDPEVLAHFSNADSVDRYAKGGDDAMTPDGVLLDYRWVVDTDGRLKLGVSSCAGCHTRLMPDGSLLRGAPSNFDLADWPGVDKLFAGLAPNPELQPGEEFYQFYGVPWLADDPHAPMRTMSPEALRARLGGDTGEPTGTVFNRFNGSPLYTTRMADLIGVKDRRYLDTTGSHANRGPEDIARYGILVEFADNGVFGPHRMTTEMNLRLPVRPPDEAMYALGLYVYSLEHPPSPWPFDEKARRGQEVFAEEGCADCHTPPIYTNNQLVAVPGFEPPADDPATRRLHISPWRVGTDPGLALRTRKGTGYYRIPTLRGLWYRGLYEHSGSLARLEDWFDPRRLEPDFVPTGWRAPASRRAPFRDTGSGSTCRRTTRRR